MNDTGNRPLRLELDGSALAANWRALAKMSGRAGCGAAVKADAYGLGVIPVVEHLRAAGCRDFYVATWQEAAEIEYLVKASNVTVLNGVMPEEMDLAKSLSAKPMLNSIMQAKLWRDTGLACDLMINSGMNRLGINPQDVRDFDWADFRVDVLASHLASADEDVSQNMEQLAEFHKTFSFVPHSRKSLANSAGIALGADYALDLTRPGLSLYGGIPRSELAEVIQSVGQTKCRILQIRSLSAGDKLGYNAKFIAEQNTQIGIISIGYADGYMRNFSNSGHFFADGTELPVLGRVSMDLVAIGLDNAPHLGEGDWVELPLDLSRLAQESGLSQYEVLTSLNGRFDRTWKG